MKGIGAGMSEPIDHKTCQAICSAVGERLQRDLKPQFFEASDYLDHLLEELRKRDEEHGPS